MTVPRAALRRAPVEFPPGIDYSPVLRAMRHGAFVLPGRGPGDDGGSDYRRAVTRRDPVAFALTYLPHHLRHDVSGLISFSRFHLDMAAAARRWIAPGTVRDGWVAPRGAAKTTWLFLILPLWALAHGHRGFLLAFAFTEGQAVSHLANLRMELDENELLLADFPELAPRRARGARNTATTVVANGGTIAAAGLGGTRLGFKVGARRPDLLVGDDLEPDAADHTPAMRDKIVSKVVNGILPMGSSGAVAQIAGTTTMHGSLVHDLVRAAAGERTAPWIASTGIRARHYPPVVVDPDTGAERSMWPQRWSLDELRAMAEADPQSYALNMANRPEQAGARGYWTRELFRYDPRIEVTRRILYVDPAMTNNRTSDQTAIVVVGLDRAGRRAVDEHAEAGSFRGLELRERCWSITAAHPLTLREWWIETNQGGERNLELLQPFPPGVAVAGEHVRGHKRTRIGVALGHYQRGAVVHAVPLPALEEQQLAWTPAADRDDLLDALAGALRVAFPAA